MTRPDRAAPPPRARAPDPLRLHPPRARLALGGGRWLQWAPRHSLAAVAPGCWDGLRFFAHAVDRGFSYALLEDRLELPLRLKGRVDARLERVRLSFRDPDGSLDVREERVLVPGDVLAAEVLVRNRLAMPRRLALVLFTAQPFGAAARPGVEPPSFAGGTFAWARRAGPLRFGLALGGDRPPAGHLALPAHDAALPPPLVEVTPFPDALGEDGASLPGEIHGEVPDESAVLHLGLCFPLGLEARGSVTLRVGLAAAEDPDAARAALHATLREAPAPLARSRRAWRNHLRGAPRLASDDPFLEQTFRYRVALLHQHRLAGGFAPCAAPAIAEGPDVFHMPIAYSAPAIVRDARWLHDPRAARGLLAGFAAAKRADGLMQGFLDPQARVPDSHYHADFGAALAALDAVHGLGPAQDALLDGFGAHLDALLARRDPEDSGLIDVVSPLETGQEVSSRYLAAAPEAGATADTFAARFRLKGVDATVAAWSLARALERLATTLGRGAESHALAARRERLGAALLGIAWDAGLGLFTDRTSPGLEPTGVSAAVGFLPFATDLVDARHVGGLVANLEDPSRFGTPWPVPSLPLDDPRFDADGRWHGARRPCPWNGRVWPMTNCLVIEALLVCARRLAAAACVPLAARLLESTLRMMCDDGDPLRPNAHEHYDPFTGRPSRHRGIEDYLHSFVLDLLVRGAAGFEPRPDGFTVDPLPLAASFVRIEDLPWRGRRVTVERRDDAVRVLLSSGERLAGRLGEAIEYRA